MVKVRVPLVNKIRFTFCRVTGRGEESEEGLSLFTVVAIPCSKVVVDSILFNRKFGATTEIKIALQVFKMFFSSVMLRDMLQ